MNLKRALLGVVLAIFVVLGLLVIMSMTMVAKYGTPHYRPRVE